MDARSQSTGPSVPTTAVDRGSVPGKLRQGIRRGGNWPWLIVGLALLALKAQGLAELLHHRVEVILLIGLGLAFSVLRIRPVAIALTFAALFAFALDPRSAALGIGLGFVAFSLLMALFMAIATVLHARQTHDQTGVPRVTDGLHAQTQARVRKIGSQHFAAVALESGESADGDRRAVDVVAVDPRQAGV